MIGTEQTDIDINSVSYTSSSQMAKTHELIYFFRSAKTFTSRTTAKVEISAVLDVSNEARD